MKLQIIVDFKTKMIVCIAVGKGREHDFSLFKDTVVSVDTLIQFLTDSGYQGICDFFPNSLTPVKKSKKQPLTKEDKSFNRMLSSSWVVGEHVNRSLKIFRILSERYRNRRKRFGLRANLIAGLYNFELAAT